MKHSLELLSVCFVLSVMMGCSPRPAPPEEMILVDGGTLRLESLRGRPVWLEFWTPWDPASKRRILDMQELAEALGESGPRAVAVAVGCTAPEVRELLGPGEMPMILALDDRVARAFAVEVVPTTLLLDAEGREVWRRAGYVEPQLLRARLEELQPRSGSTGRALHYFLAAAILVHLPYLPLRGPARNPQAGTSKRSRFITLAQAATKSCTNFSCASSQA